MVIKLNNKSVQIGLGILAIVIIAYCLFPRKERLTNEQKALLPRSQLAEEFFEKNPKGVGAFADRNFLTAGYRDMMNIRKTGNVRG